MAKFPKTGSAAGPSLRMTTVREAQEPTPEKEIAKQQIKPIQRQPINDERPEPTIDLVISEETQWNVDDKLLDSPSENVMTPAEELELLRLKKAEAERNAPVSVNPTSAPATRVIEKSSNVTKWVLGCLATSMFGCLLYTSPSPRDGLLSRMPSSA